MPTPNNGTNKSPTIPASQILIYQTLIAIISYTSLSAMTSMNASEPRAPRTQTVEKCRSHANCSISMRINKIMGSVLPLIQHNTPPSRFVSSAAFLKEIQTTHLPPIRTSAEHVWYMEHYYIDGSEQLVDFTYNSGPWNKFMNGTLETETG